MDALTRRQFDRAMFAKDRTLAIRVGDYASRDIKEASFEYGYIKGDTYKPGGTCAGSGKITFTSIITTFNKLDILHPEIGLLVGNTYQWVKMGEYFINDIEIDRNRNTTTLELMDGMFKLNREYVTDLHFPAEVREVIQEICLKTGIELANDYFGISAMRYHVEQVPEGKKLSFRDMLSAMTQMIGMSCFFNREGKMEIRDLTESNITINADSYFLHGLTKSEIEYQIAGITCKTDKKSLTVGMKTGRSLELDNVFMTQSALNDLYYKLKNLTYYPYNLNYQGHLLLEVGQWVTIQTNKKETFKVPVLSQSFTFKGGLRGRISADSKAGNDTQYSYEGTITKQIKQQDGIEAKIQAQIEAADAAFEAEFEKRKKEIDDGIELAKAKAEEVKQDISNEIDKRFQNFDNASIQEARRKAEEALRSAGASSSLAQEAKTIADQASAKMNQFKQESSKAQHDLSENVNRFKSELQQSLAGKADNATVEQTERALRQKFESLSTDTVGKIDAAKTEFEKTAQGLSTKITNIETYVNSDGQRQDDLKRYAREESASQARAVRELVTRDFVGKSAYQEDVRGLERRFEAITNPQNGSIATQIAKYKTAVDGRFADITSLISGKANQADFQRVKETSQLYERILGNTEQGLPDKISRMVMSNEIFQTEVGKYVTDDNNLIVNSMTMDKHTLVRNNNPKANISVSDGIFTIKAQGLTGYNWSGFTLPIYVKKIYHGETYTLGFKYRIKEYPDSTFSFNVKNHGLNKILLNADIGKNRPPLNEWQEFQKSFTVQEDFAFGEDVNYPFYIYLAKNGWIEFKEPILVRGSNTGPYKPSQFDDAYKLTEATRTQVTQLAGSYAIRNLNSAGDLISGLNLGANGHNRFDGKLTHITGETLIDNAVIKSAMIDKLKTANFEAGSVTTTILDAEAVTADKLKVDNALIRKITANEAFIDQLTSKRIFATKVESVITSSTVLEGYKGWIGGFQLGTHDSGYGRWITGRNHFSVGMGNGEGGDGRTALWVNWGNNWSEPGYYAWFVKNNGKMYCYNTAEFWKTPIIHGDLKVTGKIRYDGGVWIYSSEYEKIGRSSKDYFYLEKASGARDWFPAWNDTSDRRLKSNIQESDVSGLDVINRLKTYSYRKEFNNEVEDISCGIMAQDVQKYAPDAFRESPDGVYTYNTFALVPYLIKAIQELNQKIEKMEKTIA